MQNLGYTESRIKGIISKITKSHSLSIQEVKKKQFHLILEDFVNVIFLSSEICHVVKLFATRLSLSCRKLAKL